MSDPALKALAIEFAACLPPDIHEELSDKAFELARLYDRATPKQRAAFDALAASFKGE